MDIMSFVEVCPNCNGKKSVRDFFPRYTNVVGIFIRRECVICFGSGVVFQETYDEHFPKLDSFAKAQELARLAALRDEGVITQEEYDIAADKLNETP